MRKLLILAMIVASLGVMGQAKENIIKMESNTAEFLQLYYPPQLIRIRDTACIFELTHATIVGQSMQTVFDSSWYRSICTPGTAVDTSLFVEVKDSTGNATGNYITNQKLTDSLAVKLFNTISGTAGTLDSAMYFNRTTGYAEMRKLVSSVDSDSLAWVYIPATNTVRLRRPTDSVNIGGITATTELTIEGNVAYIPVVYDSSDIDVHGITVEQLSRVIIYDDDTYDCWWDWTFGGGAQIAAGVDGQLVTIFSVGSGTLNLRNNTAAGDTIVAFNMFGGDNITLEYADATWVEVARTDFDPAAVTTPGGGLGAGSVTYVGATGNTGISVTGSPITSSGTFDITNTLPDQTVTLNDGTGITVTGTYPTFTIASSFASALDSGKIWIGSAGDLPVANYLSTDVKLNSSGVATIQTDAVTTTKILNNNVTGAKIAMGSDAQGDILYYNGTDYVRLAAGTNGYYLKTLGGGANPAWATVAAGVGTVTNVSGVDVNGFTWSIANPTTTPALTLDLQDAIANSSTKGQATFTAADFNSSSGLISIDYANGQRATSTVNGFMHTETYDSAVIAYQRSPIGLSFNTGNGELTLDLQSATDLVEDLDGRYLTAEVDGSITNELDSVFVDYVTDNTGRTDEWIRNDTVEVYQSSLSVTPANVTAGSNKITLGGTPTAAALQAFSVDVDETKINHNNLLNYVVGQHYFQPDIDTVNNALTGLLKATSGVLSAATGTDYIASYPGAGVAISTGSAWQTSGTGTSGYIVKWGASNDIDDAGIYDDGSNIGIGIVSPQNPLQVNGSSFQLSISSSDVRGLSLGFNGSNNLIYGYNFTTTAFIPIYSYASTHQWYIGVAKKMDLDASGNLAVGGGSPSYLLDASKSSAGMTNTMRIENTESSNSASHASVMVETNGANGGDPYALFTNGVGLWAVGMDNSGSDEFIIGKGVDGVGSGDVMVINYSTGATSLSNSLTLGGTAYTIPATAGTPLQALRIPAAGTNLEWFTVGAGTGEQLYADTIRSSYDITYHYTDSAYMSKFGVGTGTVPDSLMAYNWTTKTWEIREIPSAGVETDPIYAADSARIVWFSDTTAAWGNTIATTYDVDTLSLSIYDSLSNIYTEAQADDKFVQVADSNKTSAKNYATTKLLYDSLLRVHDTIDNYVPKYLIDAAGDLFLGTGNNTLTRLAKSSSNGDVLTMVGGAVAWATPGAGHTAVTLDATATTAGLSLTGAGGQVLNYQAATTAQNGYLTSTDWDTFNDKLDNPLTTTGDLIYSSSGTTEARLAVGTNNQFLVSNGTIPVWSTVATGDTATTAFIRGTTTVYLRDIGSNTGFGTNTPVYFLDAIKTSIGSTNTLRVSNPDNTDPASHSSIIIQTGGTSGGDSYLTFNGGSTWSMGYDNSADDVFRLVYGFDGMTPTNSFLTVGAAGKVYLIGMGDASDEDSLVSYKQSTGELIAIPNKAVDKTTFDAAGDILVATGNNTYQKLTIGATDEILTVVGGTPAWVEAGATHNPVTIGTPANGLSLSTQQVSLGLATTADTGALSSWDWNRLDSAYQYMLFSASGDGVLTLSLSGKILSGEIDTASTSSTGVLTDTDWNIFNGKGTVSSITVSAPLSATSNPIETTATLSIPESGVATDGYLSSTEWGYFDNAYDKTITAAGFNSSTGDYTLTQRDASTIITNLDGRYIQVDSSMWIHDATLNATRQRYVDDMVVAGGAVTRTNVNRDMHVVGSQYLGDSLFFGGSGAGAELWAFDSSIYTDDDFYISSTSPDLYITNLSTTASGSDLYFSKYSASPADDDQLGNMYYYGWDDVSAPTLFAQTNVLSTDVSNGAESGRMVSYIDMNGTLRNFIDMKGYNGTPGQGEFVVNEDAQDINFRVEATGAANAIFVQGSDGKVGINNAAPDSTLTLDGSMAVNTTNISDAFLINGATGEVTVTDTVSTWGVIADASASAHKQYNTHVQLGDDAAITFFTSVYGWGTISTNYGAEYGKFYFETDGTVTLGNDVSANFAGTDSDTDICVYDGGSGIIIKNRLGSQQEVLITIHYATPVFE